MRQLFLEAGLIKVKNVERPLLTKDTLLVAVHYSFISSGTEAATIAGTLPTAMLNNLTQKLGKVVESYRSNGFAGTKALVRERLKGGLIQQLGYSCAGRVVAVGAHVTAFRPGDLVACAGAGIANHADMIAVPVNLAVKVSDESFMQQVSITTIGAIALQGVRRSHLQLGETICVIGLGLLGQLTVQLAALAGCRVIGTDPIAERREIAKKYGATAVFDPADPVLKQQIDFLTNHYGVDATLITAASKSDLLVQQAMEMTRRKGKVVLVGDVGLNLQRDPFYKKEIDFLISCSYGPGRYDATYEQDGIDYPFAYVRWTENRNMQAIVALIEQGKLSIAPLISHCVDITNADQGYARLQAKEGLGVLISYLPTHDKPLVQEQKNLTDTEPLKITFVPARKDTMRVGIIGAGGFAKVKLLPIMTSLGNVKINAVVDAQPATALSVARLYGAATVLAHDQELFDHDLVDVVVIASPHAYHADQIAHALSNNKAVFAEKPMVTTREQLKQLSTLLTANPDAPLCVDFNRSFAPFIRDIKEQVSKRSSPLMVHYRMNAGFIPKDHWVQRELGAGRIIGEACHIVDLFCFLIDAKPASVSVESLHPQQESLNATDNFVATIRFADGSVCTLLYTAVGNTSVGKERMELFFDGKTIIMDDYRTLQGYGLPASFNKTTQRPEKGHEQLIRQFFAALRQDKPSMPISMKHLEAVADLTLTIHELAVSGGGEQQIS